MSGHTDARAVLADLEAKRQAALARQQELAGEREELAFAAATGDAAARQTLATLTKDAATAAIEIENLASAIAEARRRVGQADQQARLAELRRKAEQARVKLGDLDEIGRDLSTALERFADTFERFQITGDEIRRLGAFGFPGRELLRANTSRAIDTQLARLHLGSRPVAPNQRVEIGALVAHWREQVAARVAQVLGDDDQEAA